MKVPVPGLLWVAIILMIPPLLIPVIQQFFPTNTYLWSALVVVALNAIAMAVRLAYPDEAAKVPTVPGAPGAAADIAPATPVKGRSTVSKVLFGV